MNNFHIELFTSSRRNRENKVNVLAGVFKFIEMQFQKFQFKLK